MSTQVSIGQVKRDLSELVNRVTYAGERIILTSRGKPKAALVSMEDYENLLRREKPGDMTTWLAQVRALSSRIEARRGQHIDVDSLLSADRQDLEAH